MSSPPVTPSNIAEETPTDEDVPLFPPHVPTPYSSAHVTERVNLRHRSLPKSSPSTAAPSASHPSPASSDHTTTSSGSSSSIPKPSDEKIPAAGQTKPANDKKPPAEEGEEEGGMFECNICLDTASSPIVTLCGHLYCWNCLSRWMHSNSRNGNTCPVCKAGIEKDKLIPIYCKGKTEDPRNTVQEERPAGQRPEAVPRPGFGGFNPFFGGLPGAQFNVGGANVHFSAGFGPLGLLFPLLGMGMQYMTGNGAAPGVAGANAGRPAGAGVGAGRNADARMAQVVAQQAFISRIFLLISALVFVAIVLY
ncbi:hypothetical protein HDU98_002583 [Podochytrium sp. JEL0797]|nr:hypothetical protein HDU98_002583 [Podochytrium sp. JEL0797]